MADDRYNYPRVNALKVILIDQNDKILLIREPMSNEWMPGHWGLPGGKPLVNESLLDAYGRKMQEELGYIPDLQGIAKIEELIRPDNNGTVLMYILVAQAKDGANFQGESAEWKWVGIDEVNNMDITEFTEYYNQPLLLEFLEGERTLYPIGLLQTWRYNELSSEDNYQRWFASGNK